MNLILDPAPPPAHLPRLALEEAAVVSPPTEVAAHLLQCASCQTYVATLRDNAAQFLKAHPSDRFASQILRRRRPTAPTWLAVASLAGAMAIGGIAALTLWPEAANSPARAGLQLKGSLVSTYVQRQGEAVPLRAGEALHPMDALRFVVRAEQPGFAAVLERDPEGRVTVIAPFGAGQAQSVKPGSTPLDDSAILDSTVGKDRFVAVFSPEPFVLAPLVQALSAGRAIDCKSCQVELLEFDKHP